MKDIERLIIDNEETRESFDNDGASGNVIGRY